MTLTFLLPYYPFPGDTSDYDRTYYPEGMEFVPKPYAIVRANEHMIRYSGFLICYDRGEIGKTIDFVAIVRKQAKYGLIHIENLAEYFDACRKGKNLSIPVDIIKSAHTSTSRPLLPISTKRSISTIQVTFVPQSIVLTAFAI